MRYFQIMARIGGSLVHIEGPQDTELEARARIRKLAKQKVQWILAETTAVGFAEKRKPKPIKRPPKWQTPNNSPLLGDD